MKRLLSILLAAAMLLALCACGGTQYDEALLGVYTCYSAETMGTQRNAEDVFEEPCTIELKQGGKGTLKMDGDSYSMKYTLAGETITIEADGETGGGTLKDGLMEVEILDLKLFLVQEGAKITASGSDAGYYVLTSMTEDGETYDEEVLKELGMYGTMYLLLNEDGTGVLDLGEGDITNLTWESGTLKMEGMEVSYILDANKLTIDIGDGSSMTFTRSNGTPPAASAASDEPAAPEEEPEEPEPIVPEEPEEPSSPAISNEPVSAELGEFYVTIVAAEEFTDIDGNPAIRFYYDFTNGSEELESAWINLDFAATQEGYQLISTYAKMEDDVPEYGNDDLKVQPGITIRCIAEYTFKPDGGTLAFTIMDFDDNEVTMEFDPQNLPGRPEELEMPTITEPTWTSDMASEGVYDDDYYVKLDSYEYTTGYGDVPLLRVYLEFTNNSDQATSFFFAANLLAMQDGVALETDWASETVAEDDNYTLEIEPGETILVSECFEVRSDSPIEIMVVDYWNGTTIGGVVPGA